MKFKTYLIFAIFTIFINDFLNFHNKCQNIKHLIVESLIIVPYKTEKSPVNLKNVLSTRSFAKAIEIVILKYNILLHTTT